MVIEKIVMCDDVWFGCAIVQWCMCDCAKNGELICLKRWWTHFGWFVLMNNKLFCEKILDNLCWWTMKFFYDCGSYFQVEWLVNWYVLRLERWWQFFLLKMVENIGERKWFTIRVGWEEKNKYFNKIRNTVSRLTLVWLRKMAS